MQKQTQKQPSSIHSLLNVQQLFCAGVWATVMNPALAPYPRGPSIHGPAF